MATPDIHLMARVGRNRNGWFGVSNGDRQTFVHWDYQRQPSTSSGGSAAAVATAGFDPQRTYAAPTRTAWSGRNWNVSLNDT